MSRFDKWENVHDSDHTRLTIFPAYIEPVPVQAEEAFDRLNKFFQFLVFVSSGRAASFLSYLL